MYIAFNLWTWIIKNFSQKHVFLSNFGHNRASESIKFFTILHIYKFYTILIYNEFLLAEPIEEKAPYAEALTGTERGEDGEEIDVEYKIHNYKY